jgi:hypothetical protein
MYLLNDQMTIFYYKTKFKFSDAATNWILKKYEPLLSTEFIHDLDITQYSTTLQIEWYHSLPGQELRTFLSLYSCDTSFYGICVFASNMKSNFIGNPHLDTKFAAGKDSGSIKSRFNVMILGNPNDEMVWWDSLQYNDARLVSNTFTDIAGVEYSSKSIPGNSAQERWSYLGEPTVKVSNLLRPSAFVKTDCAHTVEVSPEPRLVVTVAFDKSIEEIINNKQV